MLSVVTRYADLDFSAIMRIYRETLQLSARQDYPDSGEATGILLAEQQLREYLRDCFFQDEYSFYALWSVGGTPVSALRMEAYRDGLLVEALETAPEARCKGYATQLLQAATAYGIERFGFPIYAHVYKSNLASLRIHRKCGFRQISDCAVFIDGSVSQNALTLCLSDKKEDAV